MKTKLLIIFYFVASCIILYAQPATVTPSDETGDISQSLTVITWDDFNDGNGNGPYDFELSVQSNFSSTIAVPAPAANSADISGVTLQYYKTYYWRVRDTDIDGFGGNGNWYVYSFTTIDNYTPSLFYPANNGTDIFNGNVNFTWNLQNRKEFLAQVSFQLEYGTSPALVGATVVSNITITSHTVGLNPGVTYYWRISTVKNSLVVAQSVIRSFTTSGEVVIPEISYPKDGTTVYSNAPVFYWYTTDFNSQHFYEIEYDEDPAFGSSTSINNIPGLFAAVPGLTGGTHYYWRARTKLDNISNWSAWSDTADFFTFDVVDASIPSPAYPTGGVEVYSKFPRLYWVLNGPSQGFTYEIRYGLSLDLNNDVDISGTFGVDYWNINNIASLFVTLYEGIKGGETYYWQVRSYNGSTYSDWSDYAEFKIYNFSLDLIPILSWPIGGNTVYSTEVNFAWHVEGPSLGETYDLEYNTINDFTGGQTSVNGITENLITITLLPGQTYWWRVKVSSQTTWSNVETFNVIGSGGADVPILNWPVGGATVWNTEQQFSWSINGNSNGLKYDFDIDNNSDFSSPLPDPGLLTDQNYTQTGLTAGTTYYWRVRSTPDNGINFSNYSNVEVFVVFAGLNPETPVLAPVPRLGSPINGVEVNVANPTLSFFSPAYSEGEITYDVEYSTSPEFLNSIVVQGLTEANYNAQGLSEGTYYWRAKGKDASGYSEYSETGEFKITGVTAVEEAPIINHYELVQNYPNPFNPSTTIKFNMPEANYVSLKVYNMLGQEIRSLIKEHKAAGTHIITWDGKDNYGNNVSSGAYLYKIIAGKFIQTKKMLLIK